MLEFSRGGLARHRDAIELLRELIFKEGHTLTNDLVKDSRERTDLLPEGTYNKLQKAITDAQCVVIEGSVVSLSLGFVLTEAVNMGKPVLFLVNEESLDQRNRFVSSIKSKLLTYQNYEHTEEVKALLVDFFEHHNDIKTRFNLVLSTYLNSYITVESQKKGVSKTEYIIDLIEADERSKSAN